MGEDRKDSAEILMSNFARLNSFEQTLLTLLAISCEPAHAGMLVNCLKKRNLRNPRGNQPTTANITHYLERLQQAGLLTDEKLCSPAISEILCRKAAAEGSFSPWAEVIRQEAPASAFYGKWSTRCWRAMREMRIAIYNQQFDQIYDVADFLAAQCTDFLGAEPVTAKVLCQPFDIVWFRTLPPSLQFYLLSDVLQYGQASLTRYEDAFRFLADSKDYSHLGSDEQLPFRRLYFTELLLRGQLREAEEVIAANSDAFSGTGASGTLCFLLGKKEEAEKAFAGDLKFLQELNGSSDAAFFGLPGIFFTLSLLETTGDYHRISDSIAMARSLFPRSRESASYRYIAAAVDAQESSTAELERLDLEETEEDAVGFIFLAYSSYWVNGTITPEIAARAGYLQRRAEEQGYLLAATLLAEIVAIADPDNKECRGRYQEMRQRTGIVALQRLITPEEPWRRSLQALISATNREEEVQQMRMAWLLTFPGRTIAITAREQKLQPDGSWSRGRPVTLSRLYKKRQLGYLSLKDKEICAAITREYSQGGGRASYQFDLERAIPAMIGHPHLFLADSPQTPVEFVEGEPELLVEERGDNLHICFAQPLSEEKINFYKETPTRIKVITVSEQHRKIAQITGVNGITVPRALLNPFPEATTI